MSLPDTKRASLEEMLFLNYLFYLVLPTAASIPIIIEPGTITPAGTTASPKMPVKSRAIPAVTAAVKM
jgi:hypothetical protein